MKNHIIPISVKPGNLSNDRITVGLMAIGEKNKFYEFSSEKLKVIFPLLDSNTKKYLTESLENLRGTFNKRKTPEHLDLERELFSEEYLKYLNGYSNGLIEFGESKGFAIELTKVTFEKAFKHFVGVEINPQKETIPTFRKTLNKKLKDKVFQKVDTQYTVGPNLVSGLYTAHKLDFIGVNGQPYAGLGIDFSKSPEEVDKNIIAFKIMVDGISELAKKHNMRPGIYEAYFNSPEGNENKALLDNVRGDANKQFSMVEIDQFDAVIDRINNGHYIKFSESTLIPG